MAVKFTILQHMETAHAGGKPGKHSRLFTLLPQTAGWTTNMVKLDTACLHAAFRRAVPYRGNELWTLRVPWSYDGSVEKYRALWSLFARMDKVCLDCIAHRFYRHCRQLDRAGICAHAELPSAAEVLATCIFCICSVGAFDHSACICALSLYGL